MQIMIKRISAIMMAACLLVVLAFWGVAAWAEGEGANSLKVEATDAEGNGITTDIAVYKIANASKNAKYLTYDYYFDIEPFTELSAYFTDEMTGSLWQKMADKAVESIDGVSPVKTDVTNGEPMAGLDDGLYLVVASEAYGDYFKYTFKPTIVSLPTKDPLKDSDGNVIVDEDGYPIIKTSVEYKDWLTDAVISLKYTIAPLYGDIEITKTVSGFYGGPVEFVFKLDCKEPTINKDGSITYKDTVRYASIHYTGENDPAKTYVTHLPAGTKVTVSEVQYDGGRFTYVSGDNGEKTIYSYESIAAGQNTRPSAAFENEYKPGPPGSGVRNNYKWSEEDWEWTKVERDTTGDVASEEQTTK